jgi:hypothetical protein
MRRAERALRTSAPRKQTTICGAMVGRGPVMDNTSKSVRPLCLHGAAEFG